MRIVLADDQTWLRSAIRFLLEQMSDVEVVGEAADVQHLRRVTQDVQPDLVLLDWELPGMEASGRGRALLTDLRTQNPEIQIIIMSGRPESSRVALAAGASSFVSKADPPERLLAALRKAQQSTSIA